MLLVEGSAAIGVELDRESITQGKGVRGRMCLVGLPANIGSPAISFPLKFRRGDKRIEAGAIVAKR